MNTRFGIRTVFLSFLLALFLGPVVAAPVVSVPGLVGFWRLDDNAGTSAADDSGSGNAGTLTNGPVWTTGTLPPAGPPGVTPNTSSLSFDGVDDFVDLGTPAALDITTNITVAAWVNFSTDTTEKKVVARWSDAPADTAWVLTIYAPGGPAAFFVQPATGGMIGADTTSAGALTTGTWYHLVGTYDGAFVRMYLNGVQTMAGALTGAIRTSAAPTRIGAGSGSPLSGEEPYAGLVDDVRIYNRALTAPEVALLYTGTVPAAFTLTATDGILQNDLSWTVSTGATTYLVRRSTVTGGPYTTIATVAGTTYSDVTAAVGTPYFYVISASNAVGERVSNEDSATAQPVPPKTTTSGSNNNLAHRCGCDSIASPAGGAALLGAALLALLLAGWRAPRAQARV
ncbi:MAG TPA: LamG domain-containing protein [Planctomycetota bacterium]|nr:LamG domain-containing protein [Planctomycetota bacterium]